MRPWPGQATTLLAPPGRLHRRSRAIHGHARNHEQEIGQRGEESRAQWAASGVGAGTCATEESERSQGKDHTGQVCVRGLRHHCPSRLRRRNGERSHRAMRAVSRLQPR